MATITLQNSSLMEVTILSNTFIDNYMPEANGEFVKVYIYLLRSLSNAPVSFSLEQMADRLLCLAAHAHTDVEQTPEGVQHDLDIMDDDSMWN